MNPEEFDAIWHQIIIPSIPRGHTKPDKVLWWNELHEESPFMVWWSVVRLTCNKEYRSWPLHPKSVLKILKEELELADQTDRRRHDEMEAKRIFK